MSFGVRGSMFVGLRRFVEDGAKVRDLGCQIAWMIAYEETVIVCHVGVCEGPDDVVVEEFRRLVAQERTAGNHAESDPAGPHGAHHASTIDAPRRIEDDGERKP